MSTRSIGTLLCAVAAAMGIAVFACDRNSDSARREEPAPATPPQTQRPEEQPNREPVRDPVSETLAADYPGNVSAPTPGERAPTDTAKPTGQQADNSGRNARDRKSTNALTPLDQGESEGDRRITQEIRKAVVGDSKISMNGKNVKIITQAGKVTLRGPVDTDFERYSIESKAKSAPGVKAIDNQLEVEKH